jgi:hypothetical protein
MAGAGYKLFNTGDVLTAAQVNTYLMEQTVMVFADAAARTTALTGVVSEGMISYLKDTNAVEVYNGSAWVASDDPNAIQNTIVDAKGDLIAATANDTPARLAVGSNGDTLVADSAATTGLRWQGNYAAGKNKIINGNFGVNQRNFSTTTGFGYTFDRFLVGKSGGTITYSAETFTLGTAPVSGYESKNFLRIDTTGQTATNSYASIVQRMESVRTLAGETVTVSLWAKATSGTPKIQITLEQNFGTGGSPSSAVQIPLGSATISTSWTRYTFTGTVPSISGKTLGTDNNDFIQLYIFNSLGTGLSSYGDIGLQTTTTDFWGVQVEAGNVATSFQTATGTLQGEIALAQRYYQRFNADSSVYGWLRGSGGASSTTNVFADFPAIVPMRVKPSSIDYGGNIALTNLSDSRTAVTSMSITSAAITSASFAVSVVVASGLTSGAFYRVQANNDGTAYVGFNAEL